MLIRTILSLVWVICGICATAAQQKPGVQGVSTMVDFHNYQGKIEAWRNDARNRIGPSDSDRSVYKAFLKGPKTGITRLVFPVPCSISKEKQIKDRAKFAKECPTQYLPGNGSNFSFRKDDYVIPAQSDITIKGKVIYSMGIVSQGIMVRIGDVPVDQLSLESDGVKFLTDFVPAKTASDADAQSQIFNKGLQNGKYLYARGFRVEENCTFVLRSVAYRADLERDVELSYEQKRSTIERLRNDPEPYPSNLDINAIGIKGKNDPLFGDERKDIILVFRIIKVETDGSVSLIWKELQRKDSPKLTFEK